LEPFAKRKGRLLWAAGKELFGLTVSGVWVILADRMFLLLEIVDCCRELCQRTWRWKDSTAAILGDQFV
jgi:hypothetical protein